jgi:hypothetical protein
MTKQADVKRRVRARMARTGESYAAARSQLRAGDPATAPDCSDGGLVDALHVSNGDATDLAGTGLASRVLYWRDALHDGPVPAARPEELRRIRTDFLARAPAIDRTECMNQFAERDRVMEANRDGEYVLWFEADLYDQLQIIQVLARLAELGVPASRITLICIGEHPGIPHFGGLGELTSEQLRRLPATDACARLTPEALRLATRAWAAFTAPTPRGLGVIAAARSGELRFLGEAFDRLSREYPSTRDGLSLTQPRVLAAVGDGARDAGTAFVRAAGRETRPFLGDTSCYRMMDGLVRAPVPLLHADPTDQPVDRTTWVSLTDTGAQVLAGGIDHVAVNGIDRWIGGTHLHGRDGLWSWNEGTETLARPHE